MLRKRTGILMVAALLLTQQACSSPTPDYAAPAQTPAADPDPARTATPAQPETPDEPDAADSTPSPRASSTSPARKATGSPGGILNGGRQVVIRPLPSTESIVVVDGRGRVTTTDGEGGRSLFVLTPTGGRHMIKTAVAGVGGEPSCVEITSDGGNPLTLRAAACDAGNTRQLFTIQKQRTKDAAGRSTYAISSSGAYLQVSAGNGLIAEELGDGSVRTTFSFVDNGKATLPTLGD